MAVGEWDQRQLCPDGSCIGVIGPDGTCKVCGRAAPNWGDERNRGLLPPDDQERDIADDDDDDLDDDDDDLDGDDGDDDDDDDDDGDGEDEGDDLGDGGANGLAASAAAHEPRGEWGERRLCPNGACIGVIGDDGRCKVCGRTATDAAGEPTTAAPAPAPPVGEPTTAAPAPPVGEPTTAAPAPPVSEPTTAVPAPPVSEPTTAVPAPPVTEPAPASEPAAAATASPALEAPAPAAASAAAEPADRERCADTSCSGAVGANGRCEVCGKGAS